MQEVSPEDSFGQDQRLKLARQDLARLATFGLFFAGLFLLAVGSGIFLFRNSESTEDIQIISQDSQNQSAGKIVVHVDGAVAKPGVYELVSDARVSDAVSAAGGLSESADMVRVNLAAKVTDGQKIYIPSFAEVSEGKPFGQSVAGNSTSALVNINTAAESQLDTLPGVGSVTAQKIIASRPYGSPEELLTKKAVGQSVYEKIKDMVTVY